MDTSVEVADGSRIIVGSAVDVGSGCWGEQDKTRNNSIGSKNSFFTMWHAQRDYSRLDSIAFGAAIINHDA